MSNRPAFAAVAAGGVIIGLRARRDAAAVLPPIEMGFAVADPKEVADRIEWFEAI